MVCENCLQEGFVNNEFLKSVTNLEKINVENKIRIVQSRKCSYSVSFYIYFQMPETSKTDKKMVTIDYPKIEGGRITYHLSELTPNFSSIYPPINEGHEYIHEKGTRSFFLKYRRDVLSKYMPPMYKWGEHYELYAPHPKIVPSHRKQRWEQMHSRPDIHLTFKDQAKIKEIDDFYLLCQFQRQYYNDYTGHLHPMDYFIKDEYNWCCPPDFNSIYVQFPEIYVKYKQPLTTPLYTKRAWLEPFEPCRRLAGKYDPYPDLKFPR